MVMMTPKLGKWLLASLVVSAGLNLFLGGLLAGRWAAPPRPTFEAGGPPGVDRLTRGPIDRLAQALPADQREGFQAALAARRRETGEQARAVQEARNKVRDAIIAERFDRVALDQSLAELRARNDRMQKTFHDGFADAAQRLPLESRRKLADFQRPGRPGREGEGR